MGLFSFIKDAGSKLFVGHDTEEVKQEKVAEHIRSFKLEGTNVTATIQGDTATLSGTVLNQLLKQKLMTIVGNIHGVAHVEDQMTLEIPAPELDETHFYDVVSGNILSKIVKHAYGDAMKYLVIFEANKPMLSDPNKIYVGQKLVIPNLVS